MKAVSYNRLQLHSFRRGLPAEAALQAAWLRPGPVLHHQPHHRHGFPFQRPRSPVQEPSGRSGFVFAALPWWALQAVQPVLREAVQRGGCGRPRREGTLEGPSGTSVSERQCRGCSWPSIHVLLILYQTGGAGGFTCPHECGRGWFLYCVHLCRHRPLPTLILAWRRCHWPKKGCRGCWHQPNLTFLSIMRYM